MTRADVLIAGAGLAGLALAERLVDAGYEGDIVLVDRTFETFRHRTWCFWGEAPESVAPLVSHTWRHLRLATPREEVVGHLPSQPYHLVRGTSWGAAVVEKLRADPRVRFERTELQGFVDRDDHVELRTNRGELTGTWLFNGLGHPPTTGQLLQHFGGWEVETEEACFDPRVATLMEFGPKEEGAAFHYVLPTSANHALVEYTVFSKEPLPASAYDRHVRAFLSRNVSGPWRRVRTEYGVIPLLPDPVPQRESGRIFRIGAFGGMTKPSTGYTFLRTLAQTEQLARSLVLEGAPSPLPTGHERFRFYDRMLLRLVAERPELASETFVRMFADNDFDRVLRFLSEETSLAEEVWLLSALPFFPFAGLLEPGGWLRSGKPQPAA